MPASALETEVQAPPPIQGAEAAPAHAPADARIEVVGRLGEVLVTVQPPAGGRAATFAAARACLEAWPLATRDLARLTTALRLADGRPVVCGTIHPDHDLDDDDAFAVVLDERREAVFVVPWASPEAPAVESDAVRGALRNAGVTLGADEEALARLAAGPWREPVIVARLGQVMVEAASAEAARTQAAALLHVPEDEIEVTVQKEERGRFGLGKPRMQVLARHAPAEHAVPGRFDLQWIRGQLAVAVHPPSGSGRAVEAADVRDELAEFPPLKLKEDALAKAVDEALGVFVPICEFAPTWVPQPDGPAAVWLTDDHLAAFVLPWLDSQGAPLAAETARDVLATAGVAYGIDDAALGAVATAPFVRPVLVARGTPPQDGRDAGVEWLLAPGPAGGPRRPRVAEDGSVDYRDLEEDAAIPPDTAIARKVPVAPPGSPGRTVRDQEIVPRTGKDLSLARYAGSNVKLTADESALVSTATGMVVRAGDKISVTSVRTIEGDVDFKVGNVRFDGSVTIKGSIKPGFRVQATGAIDIAGEIDSAHVEGGGDVKIARGVVGEGSTVKAAGALRVAYLHEAHAEVGGPMTVISEIWRSTVTCQDVVQVNGRIVGGEVRAAKAVIAQTLGSTTATPTLVQAGGDAPPAHDETSAPGYKPPAVIAKKAAHANVTVRVHGVHLTLESDVAATTFREREGQIEPLKGAAAKW
ncbi:MAG: DUF342 domain-containing protein [Candidatus Rokubacteria bacterium]|nr:DUF342 domain-containing protein [Candidatus Rokubacteria bacterium]